MKIFIQIAAFILIIFYVFISCKKNTEPPTTTPTPPSKGNKPPIAKAAPDTSLTLITCTQRASVVLDGSLSSDPDNDPLIYSWKKISGLSDFFLGNTTQSKASVIITEAGNYGIELRVFDAGFLDSRDTIYINVKRQPLYEYDLDITFNASFQFLDNYKDCYYTPCSYNDINMIQGIENFSPLGQFTLYFSEATDTAKSSYSTHSYLSLSRSYMGIYGSSTINLKKLYQQGGGPFKGTFKVEDGSGSNCTPTGFRNLPPLTITGNIDTAARKATVRIVGKTYF